MILFQQGLNLWGCSPDCRLPACLPPLPSNGTNYPAPWVKQGNIHLRKKSRKKDVKKENIWVILVAVCLLWKQLEQTVFLLYLNGLLSLSCFTLVEPRTSSHHLQLLWFPPLFSVTGQILRVRGERKTPDTTEEGSFCESQREQVVPSGRGDLSSSDYRCKPTARLSPAPRLEYHIKVEVFPRCAALRQPRRLKSSPQVPQWLWLTCEQKVLSSDVLKYLLFICLKH